MLSAAATDIMGIKADPGLSCVQRTDGWLMLLQFVINNNRNTINYGTLKARGLYTESFSSDILL